MYSMGWKCHGAGEGTGRMGRSQMSKESLKKIEVKRKEMIGKEIKERGRSRGWD
jgi:hypothetical protein